MATACPMSLLFAANHVVCYTNRRCIFRAKYTHSLITANPANGFYWSGRKMTGMAEHKELKV